MEPSLRTGGCVLPPLRPASCVASVRTQSHQRSRSRDARALKLSGEELGVQLLAQLKPAPALCRVESYIGILLMHVS